MRQDLQRLLRETTLYDAGICHRPRWSQYQVASAAGSFITVALQRTPEGAGPETLTWRWGSHIFFFQDLLQALIAFAVVLAVVLVMQRRLRRS